MVDKQERITEGLRYLATEISVTRPEFCRDNRPDGAALFEALRGLGYARRGDTRATIDRYALTDAGRRRLKSAESEPASEG